MKVRIDKAFLFLVGDLEVMITIDQKVGTKKRYSGQSRKLSKPQGKTISGRKHQLSPTTSELEEFRFSAVKAGESSSKNKKYKFQRVGLSVADRIIT